MGTVGQMSDRERELLEALRAAGLRITLQRRLICRALAAASDEHLSAIDIAERAADPEAIDLSTVYRTLELFEELGVLHHVHLGHGPGIYHLSARSDHHHLVCERCGRVVDIPADTLEKSFTGIISDYGFIPDGLHFGILGRHIDCSVADTTD